MIPTDTKQYAYCPSCDAELDDIEYQGQFCETCLWNSMDLPDETVDIDQDLTNDNH